MRSSDCSGRAVNRVTVGAIVMPVMNAPPDRMARLRGERRKRYRDAAGAPQRAGVD